MALVKHDDVEPGELGPGVTARRISSEEYGAASSTASEVTLRPGAVIAPHYHDVDSTIVILSGTFEVTQGDQKWTVGPGYTLVSGPGVVHALENVGESEARQVSFHPSLTVNTTPVG